MNAYFVSVGYRPFAKYTVMSMKRFFPECHVIQITDFATLPAIGVDGIARYKYSGKLMLFIIKTLSEIEDDEFITLDDDMIITAPFHDILEGDYDVAIVKRDGEKIDQHGDNIIAKYPYSKGFMVVKNKDFYKDCLEAILEMPDLWDWWGDMACIEKAIESGKYDVRLLPEERFCKIPTKLGEVDDNATVWHYSGKQRKEWMQYHEPGLF